MTRIAECCPRLRKSADKSSIRPHGHDPVRREHSCLFRADAPRKNLAESFGQSPWLIPGRSARQEACSEALSAEQHCRPALRKSQNAVMGNRAPESDAMFVARSLPLRRRLPRHHRDCTEGPALSPARDALRRQPPRPGRFEFDFRVRRYGVYPLTFCREVAYRDRSPRDEHR